MNSSQIIQALQYGELQAFGLTMPRLAPDWSPTGASNPGFTVTDASSSDSSSQPIMTITAAANWAAPLDMTSVGITAGQPMPVTLIRANGDVESGAGILLSLPGQAWLRLGRLYCEILQGSDPAHPERERGLSCRPVLRYVWFPNQRDPQSSPPGFSTLKLASAGDDLGFSGDARFYDTDGLQIDPIAVMAAFAAILTHYPGLQAVPLGSGPVDPLPLTNYLTGASSPLASTKVTRYHLVTPSGQPYTADPLHLTGLTETDKTSGLYEMTGSPEVIDLDAVDDTTFPQYDHDRLVFGPATSGRLSSSFTAPPLPSKSPAPELPRDFFRLRVVELQSYLNGAWPDSTKDPAAAVQRFAPVRINENVSFLLDGNDVLGAVHRALDSGSPSSATALASPDSNLALVAAQAIDTNFPIPPLPGTFAHWPHFPSGITVDASATLSINLKTQVGLQASWAPVSPPGDVILEIAGLPKFAWVRVYPGLFLPNAVMVRGDGQGRDVPASGTIVMELSDPLSLRNPLTTHVELPGSAALQFDMVVVLPNGNTRIYGGLTVKIDTAVITSPPLSTHTGSNPCASASFLAVSNAGILGLGHGTPITTSSNGLVGFVEALTGEGRPRDSPRLPTMARRELLAAGAGPTSNSASPAFARTWTAVIGGGRIQSETISAQSSIGAPGSFGGRETSVTGVMTHGGMLGYDIARAALRRGQDIITRLATLAASDWDVPAESAAVAVGKNPSSINGTMAGALLQTVAPYCESPELFGLWDSQVVSSAVTQWITANVSPSQNSTVNSALQDLQTQPFAPKPALDPEPGDSTLDHVEAYARRMAIELERELTSVRYGRRDAQWALQSAIQNARHFIYIETPGFCSTAGPTGSPSPTVKAYEADLIAALKTQMQKMPGLRVIVCVNKVPDFATGYEGMATFEIQDRLSIVRSMPAAVASPPDASQFALFHPIGFPGRFARVETNVVIVDDIWAMVGGSSFRRRGLTFDGSSDLVFTDTLLENGRSQAIRDFRRGLMANRLGIPVDSTQASYVALSEPRTAFAAVSDALNGGGLGKIAPVWDGTTPGVTPVPALPADQSNPEGRDFDEHTAEIVSLLGGLSGI